MTQPLLFGRDAETHTIAELIDAIQDQGTALVLRGDPGIGKSSLLAFAKFRVRERKVKVLTTAGIESEAQYPFAGLHRLLRPLLGSAQTLLPRQAEVLRTAFGTSDGVSPSIFLIALAVLDVISESAAQTPLLLIIDDAQWLDRSTSDVLAFVSLRLESDPILMLVAMRDGVPCSLANAGLPEMRLERINDEAASALLDDRYPELVLTTREQILAHALGNPLALVELPLGVEASHSGEGVLLPAKLPLTNRLEGAFAARYATLPRITRTLLLLASINDSTYLGEILTAGARLEGHNLGIDALEPAVMAGLVRLDRTEVHFHHPLVRSAIHQRTNVVDRYSAHAALAYALADEPIRRTWHRAASIGGPDDKVATELEVAANQAQRQGAISCAVAGLERAAALSPDGQPRRMRLLRAAEMAFEMGRNDLVEQLLRNVEQNNLTPVELGRMTLLRELPDVDTARPDTLRLLSLTETAEQVGLAGEPELALTLLRVAAIHFWSANYEDEIGDRIVDAAERISISGTNPQLLVILAVVHTVYRGRTVLETLAQTSFGPDMNPHTKRLFAQAAYVIGDFERAATLFKETVMGLRDQGRLGLLASAQALRAWAAIHIGDWTTALTAAEEASHLARETSQPVWAASSTLAQAMLAGLRGELGKAERLTEQAERFALPTGHRALLAAVQWVRGIAALGDGRPADAFYYLRRPFDTNDPSYHPVESWWALSYLAEAAVYSEHEDEARAVVATLELVASRAPSPGLHVMMLYARAVLAPDAEADGHFKAALSVNLVRWPFVLARLNLAYGVWLRRQRRVAASRPPLQAAQVAFDALGAVPWGERARAELRASGVMSQPRTIGVSDVLSPQELQVVQMAAEGLSNREIGQQLYLSPRTVASHLYRAFPKLGVTSRHQLSDTFKT